MHGTVCSRRKHKMYLMMKLILPRLNTISVHLENEEGKWTPDQIGTYVRDHLLTAKHVEVAIDLKSLLSLLLTGKKLVLIDGWNQTFACASQGRT